MNIYLYYLLDENERVCYVGYTYREKQRQWEHKKSKPPHTFQIVEEFDNVEAAKIAEIEHIKIHDTFFGEHGWNKTAGGDRGGHLSGENHPSYIDGLRRGNPKEYKRRWYQKNKEKMIELHKQWTVENPDKVKEIKRRYREKNRELLRQKSRERYQKKKELKLGL
jgi:hypothetical protein